MRTLAAYLLVSIVFIETSMTATAAGQIRSYNEEKESCGDMLTESSAISRQWRACMERNSELANEIWRQNTAVRAQQRKGRRDKQKEVKEIKIIKGPAADESLSLLEKSHSAAKRAAGSLGAGDVIGAVRAGGNTNISAANSAAAAGRTLQSIQAEALRSLEKQFQRLGLTSGELKTEGTWKAFVGPQQNWASGTRELRSLRAVRESSVMAQAQRARLEAQRITEARARQEAANERARRRQAARDAAQMNMMFQGMANTMSRVYSAPRGATAPAYTPPSSSTYYGRRDCGYGPGRCAAP